MPTNKARRRKDILPPYATVIVQPGDTCGTNPPADGPGGYCIGFTYATGNIDPSCGSINWYLDSSQVPGATMTFAPSTTDVSAYTFVYVGAPANTPVGTYPFIVGGTCTNSNAQGVKPGAGSFTLAIVSTDIMDKTQSPPATVTAPAGILHDQVGAEESLYAQASPSDAQPYMSSVNWSMPYGTPGIQDAYVNGYTQTSTSATISPVTTTDNPAHFFPIAPYNGPGQIAFSAQSGSAGTAFHATATMIIDAPTAVVNPSPAPVNIGTIPAAPLTPVLTAGWTNEKPFSGDGMEWSVNFSSGSQFVHGQAGMTQLAGINIWSRTSPPPGTEYFQGTNGYELDSDPQFGQVLLDGTTGTKTVPLGANSTALWRSVDDPSVPLRSCLYRVEVQEYFKDYFNFTPDPKPNFTSIPITVGYLEWSWLAFADRTQPDNTATSWQLGVWQQPTVTFSQGSTTLPIWSGLAQNEVTRNPPPC
ncbi:MAG: hypothetical protein M3N49_04465 [Candidatus Eremiobacteraeota bacterium]|nr:hypothetical protein [Candidatus Eremiobacteraeota bacterium]